MWALLLIGLLYAMVMLYYFFGMRKNKRIKYTDGEVETTFSIIIPFRNEAENIPALLSSLQRIDYPKNLYEIFLVNDASEDTSEALITEWIREHTLEARIRLIQNKRVSQSPKKDAIQTAIALANNEWILTTDADCKVPEGWLRAYDILIQNVDVVFVAGPVVYKGNTSFIEQYQLIDGLSLQTVTAGGFGQQRPILCNGANMAYKRTAFNEVNGFEGNSHLASGDDIFMLEKLDRHYPKQLAYLSHPNAIVATKPENSWAAVLQQRIRWASKTSKQKSFRVKAIGALVLLVNLMLLAAPFILLAIPAASLMVIGFVAMKLIIDYLMIRSSASRFSLQLPFSYFFASFICYPFIAIAVLVGQLLPKYTWKGRSFRR